MSASRPDATSGGSARPARPPADERATTRIRPTATIALAIGLAACTPDVPTAAADGAAPTEVAMATGNAQPTNTLVDVASGLPDFGLLVAALQ